MSHLVQGNHNYGESGLHLQLTPKYRHPVFTERIIREECAHIFTIIAAQLDVDLVATEFGPDHVHLLIRNWKDHSIAKLTQHFKGRSSYELRKKLAKHLEAYGLHHQFWSSGYFYETVGKVTAEVRQRYIQYGQRKHWVKQLPLNLKPKDPLPFRAE